MLLFDSQTQKYSFLNAATTRGYWRTVLTTHQIDLVVMEACGPSGWISDLCEELGLKTLVCSTNEEAWRWKNVKRKTDKDDALKLARMEMMKQLKPVHIPKHEVRETVRWSSIARRSTSGSTASKIRSAA